MNFNDQYVPMFEDALTNKPSNVPSLHPSTKPSSSSTIYPSSTPTIESSSNPFNLNES